MEKRIEELVAGAIEACKADGIIPKDAEAGFDIEVPRQAEHGDFSTNAALVLAGPAGMKPRDLANELVSRLPKGGKEIEGAEVAGPGFINFRVAPAFYLEGLREIAKKGEDFGRIEIGSGKRVQVEFVSANPTGPLHIGHGRGAVYGDVLANVLAAAGYDVTKEYYGNVAGGEIRMLGRSVYLRWREMVVE